MEVLQDPIVYITPLNRHVKSLPMAHIAIPWGSAEGTTNGPVKSANDCRISDTLRPKMMRRYGEVSPPSDLMMAIAMKEDATKDTEADDICMRMS